VHTSAYGSDSWRVKSGILDANWATLEAEPVVPQSYCWTVGTILKTGDVGDMV